jgi:hypothetical protein
MPFTIQCAEPGSRPLQISMDVELDELWAIYMIEDSGAGSIGGLRNTIFRRGEDAPPPNSTMLFECKLTQGLDEIKMRTTRVNSAVNVEIIRPDVRSRVTSNMDLPGGSRFEVTFQDLRSVAFSLQMAQDLATGQKLGAGGGAQKSRALSSSSSAVWMVPNMVSVLRTPTAKITQTVAKRLRKWGFSPYMILTVLSVGALLVAAGVMAYWQYKQADKAKADADFFEQFAETAEASKEAALSAEASCLAERRSLVEALGEVQEERLLLAEEALQVSLTQIIAAEVGGSREASEEALSFTQTDKLKDRVVEDMVKIRGEIKNPDLCTMYKEALGNDLPEYVLLWHPDEDVACPTEYASISNGVAKLGRWAVSDRVAKEFGEQSEISSGGGNGIADLTSDPRMKDRWNVLAYTEALRSVQTGMLRAPTGQRPPVAPGQAHLWTLAIFDQYNSMPNPPGGLNKGAERCAMDLVGEIALLEGAAEPGQPVLPDIRKVASGEIDVDPTPTAGCPWPAERSLAASANTAFRAVAQTAVVNEKKSKNEN